MKISVIGCGYLGAVHAAAMAHLGHSVVGIDVDLQKVAALSGGQATFFEPGLSDMLAAGILSGKLTFSSDIRDAEGSEVHFICVGTPQKFGGNAADLTFVEAAVDSLLTIVSSGQLIVGKSTVPVGTAASLVKRVQDKGAVLAWNPEFLREGFAVGDTLRPDRIVYGVPPGADGELATAALDLVYGQALAQGAPRIVTDYATSELVKVAANAFLATKISFINAMAEIAEVANADVTALADAIGHDDRIGRRFLNAGIGFGGGCLPKDIRAFTARAEELGCGESVAFLKEVDSINLRRRARVLEMVVESLGGTVNGKRIAVLGLAFKPCSDDIRDSPALDVAVQLKGLGALVIGHDPQAIANARRKHPQLEYRENLEDALRMADIIIVATEWPEYCNLSPISASSLTQAQTVIDGRNCLDPEKWRKAGFIYWGLGRPKLLSRNVDL